MPRGKKVQVLRLIARLNIGGPAIQALHLTKTLNQNGFCTVLATGYVPDGEEEMDYLAKEMGIKPVRIAGLCRAPHPLRDAAAFWHILRLTLRLKPDIIHTHTAKAGALGRLAGIICRRIAGMNVKLVHTYHGHVFSGYFGTFRTMLYLWIERLLARKTDQIVVLSQSQRQEICDRYKIGKPKQFQILPLGLELTPFLKPDVASESFRQKFGVKPDETLIGIIGRLTNVKNHRLFLEMARLLAKRNGKQIRFLIVGDGELRPMLEAEVQESGLSGQVIFTGWQKEMEQVYPALDLVALTSNNEGTPVTLIEALAAARPVIATSVGGVEDLLGQPSWKPEGFGVAERGILVRPQDAEGLAQGVEWLLANPKQATQLACRGREFAREFTLENLIKNTKQLYIDLITD